MPRNQNVRFYKPGRKGGSEDTEEAKTDLIVLSGFDLLRLIGKGGLLVSLTK